jgi:predicted ATPase
MRYAKFKIQNFKGIQSLQFDLDNRNPVSKIFTLVGLNESGKTTILEALSFYYDNIKDEKELTITKSIVDDVHELIPKSKKGLFNESIVIRATVIFEDADKDEIKNFLEIKGYKGVSITDHLDITVELKFKDSTYLEKKRLWTSGFLSVKSKVGSKLMPKSLHIVNKSDWILVTTFIEEKLLPAIIYYPNFLFDFPDQIFLEEQNDESKEQVFYRNVLQDILTSIDTKYLLQDHVVNRFKSEQSKDIASTEAVMNKMSGQVTRFLTKNKINVFSKLLDKKDILIKFPKKDSFNKIYLEIKLKSGDDEYYIRERSLGFRWFFIYLLFTQFRTFRSDIKKLIFLFDEPASNLHQTGQHRLLEAFGELTENTNAFVIYSTHSHHLISPKLLETTYIVKNNALNYDNENEFNSYMTDISIVRYRDFVSKNPTQVNYFQPILDVLDYRPSNLENIPDIIMLEGKNDFYTLQYFNEVIFNVKNLNFVPGTGSGTLDTIIQLYYSWGRNFIILLDSDKAGKTQKNRYTEKFGSIINHRIFTLSDINSKWDKKALERIFEDDDAIKLQTAIYKSDTKVDKKRFNLALQELLINTQKIELSSETTSNFKSIFNFLSLNLKKGSTL